MEAPSSRIMLLSDDMTCLVMSFMTEYEHFMVLALLCRKWERLRKLPQAVCPVLSVSGGDYAGLNEREMQVIHPQMFVGKREKMTLSGITLSEGWFADSRPRELALHSCKHIDYLGKCMQSVETAHVHPLLDSDLERGFFARAQNLHTLTLSGVAATCDVDKMPKWMPNLTDLHLTAGSGFEWKASQPVKWPSLKKLWLVYMREMPDLTCLTNVEDLMTQYCTRWDVDEFSCRLPPKLKTLRNREGCISLDLLDKAVGKTLEHLHLFVCQVVAPVHSVSQLGFPKLGPITNQGNQYPAHLNEWFAKHMSRQDLLIRDLLQKVAQVKR